MIDNGATGFESFQFLEEPLLKTLTAEDQAALRQERRALKS
jgi:hypothetical protein